MIVEIESLPNCVKNLRVEVPADRVNAAREIIARDFIQYAKIPGYRPGKAPKSIIEKRFSKEIQEELKRKLVGESYREAIKEKNLRVIAAPEVEAVDLALDSTLRFTAKLTTAPEFEVPDYKDIPVTVPSTDVTPEEVDGALEDLRERFADFKDLEPRPLQIEDFCVVDYTGTFEGKPLDEAFPGVPPYLNRREDFWLKLTPETFIPGFSEQVAGLQKGESKSIKLTVPEDFPFEAMRGKEIDYQVTIKEQKERILPELNDEFAAKVIEGKTFAELRSQIEGDLKRMKERQAEEAKRKQIIDFLTQRVECELPSRFVRHEAQRIMDEIVRDNQQRGVTEDMLKEHEKEIATNASAAAKNRLKTGFILVRIAEKEGIKVEQAEMKDQVRKLAERYNMTYEKTLELLDERGALGQIEEEILVGKVLDFLISTASVQTS